MLKDREAVFNTTKISENKLKLIVTSVSVIEHRVFNVSSKNLERFVLKVMR